MTFEERLQALTETVELIAGMQMTNEKSIKALAVTQEFVANAVSSLAASVDRVAKNIDDAIGHMDRNIEILIRCSAPRRLVG